VWLNPDSLKRSGLQIERQERLIWLENVDQKTVVGDWSSVVA
jgi:hypothetical protein